MQIHCQRDGSMPTAKSDLSISQRIYKFADGSTNI